MTYSWAGKILHVDLTPKRIWKDPLDDLLRTKFLGGRGINAKLLWNLIRNPGIDPLEPENVLIFGAGCLTGTSAPSCGRTTVTCKSPLTNLYLKCSMGGHWGAELKFAGYDHLVLHGKSSKPVFLWICDENIEIRDASHLWGMNVKETDEAIKKELSDNDIRVACIGPAGENLVKIAALMSCVYCAAARGGVGAVMGSKMLKAIVVKGTGEVKVKEPERFHDIAMRVRDSLHKDSCVPRLSRFGTAEAINGFNETYRAGAKNFLINHLENVEPLTGEWLVDGGYLKRRSGCFGCTIGCHRYVSIDTGPYKGTFTGGPEYETLASLGLGTLVIDTNSVIKANELCNLLGLDTISTGSVIQWAMESYEKGVLTKNDTDGLDLKFGNGDAMIKLIPMIASRKGKIGNLLAEGVKRASEKAGKGSWKWAVCNSKGMEHSRVDSRTQMGYALAFAVNARGPDHLFTEIDGTERGSLPEAPALIEKITGDKKWASPYHIEHRGEIVRWFEDTFAVCDSMGICAFTFAAAYAYTPRNIAEMFSVATGIHISEKEIMLSGRRIVTLERCFNVREGADRKKDDLPYRMMHEPLTQGPTKGTRISPKILNQLLDQYYHLNGLDLETGWPYAETLKSLNLEDVEKELEKIRKIPKKGIAHI